MNRKEADKKDPQGKASVLDYLHNIIRLLTQPQDFYL